MIDPALVIRKVTLISADLNVHEGLKAAARDIPLYLRHIDACLKSLPES